MQKLATVAFIGVLCASPALVAAATPGTQILQQRTTDGRLLLTDQPAAGAKTERSWQVAHEDPAVSRQRAIDVKAEANLVSERIQRSIDHQRRADDEAQRTRLAGLAIERDRRALRRDDDTYGYGGDGYGYAYGYAGGGYGVPFRASRYPGLPVGDVGIMDPTGTRGERGHRGDHGKPNRPTPHGNRSR